MNMNKHKTWALALLAFLVVFFAVNFAIWRLFTGKMLDAGEYWTPDLVRVGYITGSTLQRKPECTLPKQYIETPEYAGQRMDVLTLGDSFSNMRENGRDPMYQDWLASTHDLAVLNVRPLFGLDEFTTLIALLNSGYLDRVRPRAVILEVVERHCVNKIGKAVDFALTKPLQEVLEQYRKPIPKRRLPSLGFVNMSNFKFLANSIFYKFSPNAFFSQVYCADLSAPFFTVPRDRRLLFCFEDLSSIPHADNRSVRQVNENLNTLARLLKKKGIALYFMPAANKYTIYGEYIAQNPYSRSVFFELLRKLPKQYVFVDTKKLLSEEVQKGEKDVYYSDDTHWSWKASKKIAESMKF
jgi:hypothetical protein